MSTERQIERGRIEAILTSDKAKGRAELAQHLAFRTDTPTDAALNILANANSGSGGASGVLSPEELAARVNAMNGVTHPSTTGARAPNAGGALSAEEVARRVNQGTA
jgi:hypothetical protein